ncbi:hypothetical protein [Planctomyces sp. SH-PL62]|uniref:hypothetical protein n=1 Tax=Planctomyces sp. SH-PL62 TaxID=1636152 RepID=UPI00078B9725|nr:hypothetical protein [Planctomyces sp. SH-PL62]AMV37028.1 hypothetical protein VT85_06325 [Planctomyces sp. SH-PL62]
MSVDEIPTRTSRAEAVRRFRPDEGKLVVKLPPARAWCGPALVLLGLAYVVLGGADSELTGADARTGLAASSGFGPLGQIYGQWRPDVWPLRAAVSRLVYLLGEPGRPENGAVLWPSAVAGLIAGWLIAHRLIAAGKTTAALLFGFAWFGSGALLGHSGSSGIDFLSGMATIAALDRLVNRRSDWIAGTWASFAFLAGGWPPLVVLALAVIVLGRRDSDFSLKLIAPPVLTAVVWLAWTVQTASAEAAAAALVWPLTQKLAWTLPTSLGSIAAAMASPLTQKPVWAVPLGLFVLGMPLSPFALLLASGPLQRSLKQDGSGIELDWLRIGIASLIGGTIVPGLASASALPALAGLLVAAAAVLEAAWSGGLSPRARRAFFGIALALTVGWVFVAAYATFVMAIVFTYYRPIGVVLAFGSLIVAVLAWRSVETRSARRAVIGMLVLTACLKWLNWGYYTPEWNYRYGQGPWGRAIGQWLLPHWTIHTLHEWPEDLAWAVGRPIRLIHTPQHLAFPETSESRHVLLLESEFVNWPPSAPKLVKVASFEPPHPAGSRRILARTEGELLTPSGRLVSRVPAPE